MTTFKGLIAGVSMAGLLAGCATKPMGPTVQVMPSPTKPFAVFQDDQVACKQYADQQVGGQAQAANNQALGSAALGTVLGAGLGAAIGGGRGAAAGAATGAVVGTGIGAGSSTNAQYSIQRQYDIAYMQCMYGRGNQVPGYQPSPLTAPPPPPPSQ